MTRKVPSKYILLFILVLSGLLIGICQLRTGKDPENVDTRLFQDLSYAEAFIDNGKYSEAEFAYDQLLNEHPLLSNAMIGRAIARFHQTNYSGCLIDLEQARALGRAKDAESRFFYGACLRRAGRIDEAVSELSLAISKSPTILGAYFERGISYLEAAEYRKAEADFGVVIDRRPDFVRANLYRSECYINMNRVADAENDLNRYVEVRGDDEHSRRVRKLISDSE